MRPLKHIKKPQVQNLSKGGVVLKVKHYDSGGSITVNGQPASSLPAGWTTKTTTDQFGGQMVIPVPPPQTNATQDPNSTTLIGPTANGQAVNTGAGQGLSGALGTSNNFQAGYAPVQAGTDAAQLNGAYNQAVNGIAQQQNIAGILGPGAIQAANTQNALTGELQGVINGTGPNAAQTQLQQNTGVNVANTAALQAGQRGGAQNVGLLARQIGQQGAATQQQAVGQAGTQQAQQQLAAQQAQAALAAQQAGQAQTATSTLNSNIQGEQGILQGANNALNAVNVQQQAGVNATNAGVAAGNQQQGNNLLNDIGNALGVTSVFGGSALPSELPPAEYKGGSIQGPHASHVANYLYADGGMGEGVPALVSPGERYLSPDEVKKVMEEGVSPKKLGKVIPGHAKVKGDSIKNDMVPVTLEEGGVVIPRHLMKPGTSPEKVELFIHRSVARKNQRRESDNG